MKVEGRKVERGGCRAIAHARQLPSPGTPGQGRVRVIWRTRCAGLASTWSAILPENLVLGITLTPSRSRAVARSARFSRSTGRGRVGQVRATRVRPGGVVRYRGGAGRR